MGSTLLICQWVVCQHVALKFKHPHHTLVPPSSIMQGQLNSQHSCTQVNGRSRGGRQTVLFPVAFIQDWICKHIPCCVGQFSHGGLIQMLHHDNTNIIHWFFGDNTMFWQPALVYCMRAHVPSGGHQKCMNKGADLWDHPLSF